MPKISLVLCTIGRTDKLPRFLNSLADQRYLDFELIVVDQSPDGWFSKELAASTYKGPFQIVRSRPGLSRARNVGLKLCSGEVVGFPDDDCWYQPGTLQEVSDKFSLMPVIDFATGRTRDGLNIDSNGTFMSASVDIDKFNVWFSGNSNSIFIKRSIATMIGGFNENLGVGAGTPYGSGEETDLLLRILASGGRGHYFSDLVVHHDQVETSLDDAAFNRAALYSRGFGKVLALNKYSYSYFLWRLFRMFGRGMIELLKGDFRRARFKMVWLVGVYVGYHSHG
jgi:glycosyltransferase involved in cell wall biosynthesis